MSKPNVFIRGIYSTALTKIFLDAGYPIIFPSPEVQKRFNLPFRPVENYSKDISIQDRLDAQGVSVMFKKSIWDRLAADNFKDFPLMQLNNPNLIMYNARFHKNSIYRGLIIKSSDHMNYSIVRLIPEDIQPSGQEIEDEFRTTLGRYPRYIPDAKEGIFQVTHEDVGKSPAALGSFYTVPGDLLVIVPYNTKVIISKEIINGRQKKRLFDLGKSLQHSEKYGFIFRTAAELASDEEINEEAGQLEQDLIQIQNTITQFPNRIGEIYSNYRSFNVLFPGQQKIEFDNVRNQVLPTLTFHHCLKSGSNFAKLQEPHHEDDHRDRDDRGYHNDRIRSSGSREDEKQEVHHFHRQSEEESDQESISTIEMVDFTENLMLGLDPSATDIVSTNFLTRYFNEYLYPRRLFQIFHQKLNGKMLRLAPGIIQRVDKESTHPYFLVLNRRLREGGLLDGLNLPIENGDYAISEYRQADWFYRTSYFTAQHELKGRYFNVNTPIEITPNGIHYIDLEIDVIENMVGERKILDQDLLKQAFDLGIISEELNAKAINLADKIVKKEIG